MKQRKSYFRWMTRLLAFLIMCMMGNIAAAEEIHVAVASNFTEAIKKIAEHYEAATGNTVILAFGSTGKHYAQIKNGAPFDAFFAADVKRPELLEQEGIAKQGSRFTYAIGRLALWSAKPGLVDASGKVLHTGKFRYLAIANPRLAPYGLAAKQVLQARGIWKPLQGRIVKGENVSQTYQFITSGNAALGFIAYAQIKSPGRAIQGSYWLVPQSLHDSIEQQAVLLKNNQTARDFLKFARSDAALAIIHGFGYNTP
ncbi:MAG: molybdate ABC transporter substrate-binding protein [Thermodesulfobacteriota bacterium]|nr:molybdate ABC transporter substrate-binding protein [Thermodesulfobacteriota bacterium]